MITEKELETLLGMLVPVVCSHCGAIYDLCAGEPTARYADCTCFITPCCGRHADDRMWKSLPDFTRLRDLKSPFGLDASGFCRVPRIVGRKKKDDEHIQEAGTDPGDGEQAGRPG
jgi:hypothetical protein